MTEGTEGTEVAVPEETPEPERIPPYVPPVAAPIGAPRRRRGRVVAPAGPPRAAGHHEQAPVSDG